MTFSIRYDNNKEEPEEVSIDRIKLPGLRPLVCKHMCKTCGRHQDIETPSCGDRFRDMPLKDGHIKKFRTNSGAENIKQDSFLHVNVLTPRQLLDEYAKKVLCGKIRVEVVNPKKAGMMEKGAGLESVPNKKMKSVEFVVDRGKLTLCNTTIEGQNEEIVFSPRKEMEREIEDNIEKKVEILEIEKVCEDIKKRELLTKDPELLNALQKLLLRDNKIIYRGSSPSDQFCALEPNEVCDKLIEQKDCVFSTEDNDEAKKLRKLLCTELFRIEKESFERVADYVDKKNEPIPFRSLNEDMPGAPRSFCMAADGFKPLKPAFSEPLEKLLKEMWSGDATDRPESRIVHERILKMAKQELHHGETKNEPGKSNLQNRIMKILKNDDEKVKSELEHMGMPISGDDDELRARLINALCEDTWCNNALGVRDR